MEYDFYCILRHNNRIVHWVIELGVSYAFLPRNSDKKVLPDNMLSIEGDIHKYQHMNVSRTISYAGSLIQQNHGERIENHGFVIRCLSSGNMKFVEVPNNWGFYTFHIKNNKLIIGKDVELCKYPKIRFMIESSDREKPDKIIQKYANDFGSANISLITPRASVNNTQICTSNNNKNTIHPDLSDYNVQVAALIGYLKTNGIDDDKIFQFLIHNMGLNYVDIFKELLITENIVHRVKDTLTEMFKFDIEKLIKNNKLCFEWKILNLSFSNLFSF